MICLPNEDMFLRDFLCVGLGNANFTFFIKLDLQLCKLQLCKLQCCIFEIKMVYLFL